MKIIALGSPGVGKGTYTTALVKVLGIIHISTGDLFRENLNDATKLGLKAKKYIGKGELVPDSITIEMVRERLSRSDVGNGFILDGFPRTIEQAEALAKMTDIDMVINFKADHKIILQRLSGRLICRGCGQIYHKVHIPSKVKGICDDCSGILYQRDDDKPEAVEKRLQVYEKQTAPLIDYYKNKCLLREITINEDFGKQRKEILDRILAVIRKG